MKKNLLLLLAFVFTLSIFTSCGDDDKQAIVIPAIAGTWKTAPVVIENDLFLTGPVGMEWTAPEGTKLGMLDIPTVVNMAEGLGGQVLTQVLKEVKLHEDGNISATYSDAGVSLDQTKPIIPVWKNSGTGVATYKEVAGTNTILLFIDVKKIGADDKMLEAVFAKFPVLKELVANGIPVNYVISDDKKLSAVYIDKAVMDKLLPIIEEITPLITDESLDGSGAFIRMTLESLPAVMKVTTKFEVGLNLLK